MAEHKVSGGTMLLFIDPNGGTSYDTVVCLKSVGVSDSINPIDTSSWCGSGKLPGLLNISYTFDGFHIQDVDTGRISGTDLRILLRNKTNISWKIAPESPVGGDEIQTGFGFISQLSSNYSFDNVGDFSMTVDVKGIPTTTIAPSFYLGMEYGGGIIAYIDESGEHGLIRAFTEDFQYNNYPWSSNNVYLGGTTADYGDGYTNSLFIINNDGGATATITAFYTSAGGYLDWFLPSLNELSAIYSVGQLPTGLISNVYWSSSEINSTNANSFDTSGNDNSNLKSNNALSMPCRYF